MLLIEIVYDVEGDKAVIKTNVKKDAIAGILETWICMQIGQGADNSKAIERAEYSIVIRVDLTQDDFFTASNTGNKGLTCGIVGRVLGNLEQVQIEELS